MRVFVSRTLSSDSILRQMLESKGLGVVDHPMVLLSHLPIPEVPAAEWVFFSSKNAVKYFFQNRPDRPLAQPVRWAAIGPATATALATYCPFIDFTGTGDPEETARKFEVLAANQTVLFPSARHSRKGVQGYLSEKVHCITLEVYDNIPRTDPPLQTEDVLVFTSPMSAQAYFSKHRLLEKQQVIAIGKSTFSALQSMGATPLSMAAAATEEALAEAVFGCLGV